jgi:CBS domain-containing protein
MRRLQRTIEETGWTRAVPKLAEHDPVARAFEAMRRESHDCVLVMNDDQLAGIFTSRDFLNRVAAKGADPATTELSSVMTRGPRTLSPDDPVAFAINWMAIEGFRNVPIVDDAGDVLGVLTVWDVMRHLGELFDEIDATPRSVQPQSDVSGVVSVDIGGG